MSVSALAEDEVLELIEALEAFAQPVLVADKPRPLSVDPNDDMILDVAINGKADILVTNNKRHFTAAATRFGIKVLSPAELLCKLKEENADGD